LRAKAGNAALLPGNAVDGGATVEAGARAGPGAPGPLALSRSSWQRAVFKFLGVEEDALSQAIESLGEESALG
jgi:hypothetical protein